MAECLVGFGHAVGILTLLHRRTTVVHRVQQFIRKTVLHRMFAALAGGIDDPADRQSLTPFSADLDRYLIRGTAYPARPDFYRGFHIIQRLVKHPDGIRLGATPALQHIESIVNNALRDGRLTIIHQSVQETSDDDVAKLGVRKNFALNRAVTARHERASLFRPLRAIQRTALPAFGDPLRVQHAAKNVVTYARKILYPAAADQDH